MRLAIPSAPVHSLPSFASRHRSMLGGGILGIVVLGVLVMLVVPLTQGVLDTAIAINLCASVLVLLTAFFLPEPARLPSFPTIILVTTLFRLAINVSSTRLVLLEADAGDIIQTFGNFAAGGSIVVGAVVFVVLTIVQFVVIAKGSERVAEVAARFTLDAMQGRQLSIDADLSGGRITPDEAKRRRSLLDRESKLYGAMDGAMKFVKGDAIAGIVISVINVVAGLVIGVVVRKMGMAEAASTYTILTIGDGLVSQIPSLLISVAAGLVVTRVASGQDGDSNAASDMAEQLAQLPGALLGAALVMFLVGVTSGLTGFPPLQFFALGGLLAAIGVPVFLRQRRVARTTDDDDAQGKDAAVRGIPLDLITVDRIGLRVGPDLLQSPALGASPALGQALAKAVESAARERGIPMPAPVVRSDQRFADGYAIYLHTRIAARASIAADESIALCTVAEARAAGAAEARPFDVQWDEPSSCRVKSSDRLRLEARNIVVLTIGEAMGRHLRSILVANASVFLSLQDVFNLLEAMRRTHPDVVTQVASNPGRPGGGFSTLKICEVLVELADEQIPLRDLPAVLSGLGALCGQPSPHGSIAESLRPSLRSLVMESAESEPGRLSTVELSAAVARRLADVDELGDPAALGEFKAAWSRATADPARRGKRLAILVPNVDGYRPKVRRAIRQMLPSVPVITSCDVPAGFDCEIVAAITQLSN